MCLPGLCQAVQIHAVRRMECFLDLMIQDRQICYLDHMYLLYIELKQNQILCYDEVDQHQEVASTNEAIPIPLPPPIIKTVCPG